MSEQRLRIPFENSTHASIVSSLVTAQPRVFLMNLARWLLVAVPATYTNSMLEYLQSELGLAYRTRQVILSANFVPLYSSSTVFPSRFSVLTQCRLTQHALGTYLDPPPSQKEGDAKGEQLFYKLANLDDRIKNADQYLTVDIQLFSNKLAEIYSNIAKPVLDVMYVFGNMTERPKLTRVCIITSFRGMSVRKDWSSSRCWFKLALVCVSNRPIPFTLLTVVRAITPPFGQYAAHEGKSSIPRLYPVPTCSNTRGRTPFYPFSSPRERRGSCALPWRGV